MGRKNISNGKVITCCYCGVESAFLPDKRLHTLVCASCGAPLKAQKQRPLAPSKGAKQPEPKGVHHIPAGLAQMEKPMKRKKVKKKKSSWKKMLGKSFEEVADLIEDIFD